MTRETIHRKSFGVDLVTDTDKDGKIVGHDVNRVQRSVDALYRAQAITDEQYAACCILRDNWERSRLVAGARAMDMNKVDAIPESSKAMAMWERHKECMNAMGPAKALILSAIVLHDGTPAAQQRARPLANLESAMDWLVVYCEKGHLDRIE